MRIGGEGIVEDYARLISFLDKTEKEFRVKTSFENTLGEVLNYIEQKGEEIVSVTTLFRSAFGNEDLRVITRKK